MLKKVLTIAAFAAAAWAGAIALTGSAKAGGWPNPPWSEKCRLSHYWYHSPYDHSPCEHRNWDHLHGGWHINDEAWWVWQAPYHIRYYHHRHRWHHAAHGWTKCRWGHEWKKGHRVTVKVCKTVYY